MRILVKVSGDLVRDKKVIGEVKNLSKKNEVTLIHGAGTQISGALKKNNISYGFIGGIRHTTEEGMEICFRESQKVRKRLEKEFRGMDIRIVSPVIKDDDKKNPMIINKNAEEIFRDIHKGFDRKIIFTVSEREKPLIKNIKDAEVIRLDPLIKKRF
jgi:hypothetical protein